MAENKVEKKKQYSSYLVLDKCLEGDSEIAIKGTTIGIVFNVEETTTKDGRPYVKGTVRVVGGAEYFSKMFGMQVNAMPDGTVFVGFTVWNNGIQSFLKTFGSEEKRNMLLYGKFTISDSKDKDGNDQFYVNLFANRWRRMDSQWSSKSPTPSEPTPAAAPQFNLSDNFSEYDGDNDDDDVPF